MTSHNERDEEGRFAYTPMNGRRDQRNNVYAEIKEENTQIHQRQGNEMYLDLEETKASSSTDPHKSEVKVTSVVLSTLNIQIDNMRSWIEDQNGEIAKLQKNASCQRNWFIVSLVLFLILLGAGLVMVVMLSNRSKDNGNTYVLEYNSTLNNLTKLVNTQGDDLTDIKLFMEKQIGDFNKTYLEHTNDYGKFKLMVSEIKRQKRNGTTIFTEINVDRKTLFIPSDGRLNYSEGVKICHQYSGKVAQIKNKQECDAVMNVLRGFLPGSQITAWIGLQINPLTKDLNPPESYTAWYGAEPGLGPRYKSYTRVSLVVDPDIKSSRQGMMNSETTWTRHRVVCEF